MRLAQGWEACSLCCATMDGSHCTCDARPSWTMYDKSWCPSKTQQAPSTIVTWRYVETLHIRRTPLCLLPTYMSKPSTHVLTMLRQSTDYAKVLQLPRDYLHTCSGTNCYTNAITATSPDTITSQVLPTPWRTCVHVPGIYLAHSYLLISMSSSPRPSHSAYAS